MMPEPVVVRFAASFNDPCVARERWDALLATGETDSVFLTWHWQRIWWESFGRGELLLAVAERGGRPVAIAPMFADSGMIFFVGSGGSDYLDFVGDVSDSDVLVAVLRAARERIAPFLGFRFYLVPAASATGRRLEAAAARLGLNAWQEGAIEAPRLVLPGSGLPPAAAGKKSLLRHEAYFRREGALEIRHARDADTIVAGLPEFIEQHVARWADTGYPSLLRDAAQRDFYGRLAQSADATGWMRFTRVEWNGRPIAFHFGFCRRGTYLWYKPSFAVDLARRSPGEVLLRQLLLAAAAEGAHTFDFGLGDEAFKRRFATESQQVETWGLYP